MATYSIAFACGHTGEKMLVGKTADRDRYISWAEKSGSCDDCQKADAQAVVEGREIEYGLPPLVGSDKQIAWARKIRYEKFGAALHHIETVKRPRVTDANCDKFETDRALVLQLLGQQNTAKFWIDHRDNDGYLLGFDLAKAALR